MAHAGKPRKTHLKARQGLQNSIWANLKVARPLM